jgi:hypothetical protein
VWGCLLFIEQLGCCEEVHEVRLLPWGERSVSWRYMSWEESLQQRQTKFRVLLS